MRITIVGGSGNMGLWYASRLTAVGHDVTITGRNQEKLLKAASLARVGATTDNDAAIRTADIVVVSVPLASTPAMIQRAAQMAGAGSLICDLASVKSAVVGAYQKIERTDLELVSFHPLHGPRVSSLRNVTILASFLQAGPRAKQLCAWLSAEGAQITEIDGAEHDKHMALLQGLTHFVAIAFARTLADIEVPPFSTPAHALLRAATARVVLQDPELYAAIQLENPENAKVRQSFLQTVQRLARIVEEGSPLDVQHEIERGAALFAHPDADLADTDTCIDALTGRKSRCC